MPRDLPPQTHETLQLKDAAKTARASLQIVEEALDVAIQSIADRYGCRIERYTCTNWFATGWRIRPHRARQSTLVINTNHPAARDLQRTIEICADLKVEATAGRIWIPEPIAEPVHA